MNFTKKANLLQREAAKG